MSLSAEPETRGYGELPKDFAGSVSSEQPALYGWVPRLEVPIDSCQFEPLVVDGEPHPALEYDATYQVVSKRFSGASAVNDAQREFTTLDRLSRALRSDPYLQCPEPLSLDETHGRLLMTWCPGSQLHHTLAGDGSEIDDHLEHLGEQISTAALRYIREFNRPYWGMMTWNMLYHVPEKTLTLVDPLNQVIDGPLDQAQYPFESTLGAFFGSGVYHTVRWRRASWRNRAYWERLRRMSEVVLTRIDSDRSLSRDRIRDVSQRSYIALVEHGRFRRRLWFATSGRMLFRRRIDEILGS